MHSANPYNAELPIMIGGKPCLLVMDWNAISSIYATCGPDAANELLRQDRIYNHSPEQLAIMMHAGLRRHHPDMTLEMVKDGLPPYINVITVLARGISLAYLGVDIGDNQPVETDGEPADDSKKK